MKMDVFTKEAKQDAIGCLFGTLALALSIFLLWHLITSDIHRKQQEDVAKLSPFLKAGPIVKIVDTDYARQGTKEANYVTSRVVTCETKDGQRFNISQDVAPDHIPLIGELWEVDMKVSSEHAWFEFVRPIPKE
jgi:hypothetical protein